MTKSEKIVLYLIRKTLDKDCCIDLKEFNNVDWADVINLSMSHGVGAIAFDGVEHLPADCRPDMDNLMDWLGQTSYQETQYEHNWEVANQLAELWGEEGISATVLKGRSIAQYYPISSHRYSCDLDVLIPTLLEWDKACKVLESKGVKLVREVYKEVEFTYNDVYVECHRYITPCRGNNTLLNFEKYLRLILESEGKSFFDGSRLISPPLKFIVMLYIEHALWDLLHGKLTLKHVVDWVVLRKKNLDWEAIDSRCKEFGFFRFLNLINALADVVEDKKKLENLPATTIEVFEELLQQPKENKGKTWFQRRVSLFFEIVKNRKSYNRYGYCSMEGFLIKSIWAHFFDKEVNII